MPTRVLITGSRRWYCLSLAERILTRLIDRYGFENLTIVHGAAPGVDTAFRDAADLNDVADEPHPADWQQHGVAAGPIRNSEMVALGADFCLALHTDFRNGKGTRDCARKALAAGIPVWLIESEDGEPRRLTEI